MSKILESNENYHANLAIGSSTLKKINNKSILHAFSEDFIKTPSMVLGSAIHCAILEPERFGVDFAISPVCDKRTKEGKEIFAAFEARSQGKTIISPDQADDVIAMKNAVMSHEIARMMLTGGEAEYSYYSIDQKTNIAKKCRPDYIKNGSLIDLKTTTDASFEGFARQAGNLGYHLQAAYYVDVYNEATGNNVDEFFFVCVENTAPFAVAVYRMDALQLEAGRAAYKKALDKLADFYSRGGNPREMTTLKGFGYPMAILDLQIPFYMLNKISNDDVA
jgi:hypothetical protein